MTSADGENRLYLVCASHPDEAPLMLGKRRSNGYTRAPTAHEMNTWFDLHEKCPGAPDCFKLAYGQPQNWDVAEQASPVQKHVRLELVKTHEG